MTRDRGFAVVATFTEHVSADAFAALLLSREIKAHVGERDPLTLWLGGRVRVFVADDDVRRVRWVIANLEMSEAEFWLAATGELDPEAARRAFEREPMRRRSRAAAIAGCPGVCLLVLAALGFAGAIPR